MFDVSRTTRTVTFRSTIVEGEGSARAFVVAVNEGDDLTYTIIDALTFVSYADGVTTVTLSAPSEVSDADLIELIGHALPYSTPLARTVSDITVTTPDAETIDADAVTVAAE